MASTPRILEMRIKQVEDALGIATLTSTASLVFQHEIGSISISTTEEHGIPYGDWELLASGNLLGGQAGTVYAWKRTA